MYWEEYESDENPYQDQLAILRRIRERVNWENFEERRDLLDRFDPVISDWKGRPQDLRGILPKQEMDWLLSESTRHSYDDKHDRGKRFIDFVARSGYEDVPELDEDGKPILRLATALHRLPRIHEPGTQIVLDLFRVYSRYDANYTDSATGTTHFHVACRFGQESVVRGFLELGQDPDCRLPTTTTTSRCAVDPPLHLALWRKHERVSELLLRAGADPNLSNEEGWTPLHVISNRDDDDELAKLFFEINDGLKRTVQVDARDKEGRTPLQWAVTSLLPDVVDVLLDRGADLASFVFPTENHFHERFEEWRYREWDYFQLRVASGLLACAERLERRGYELSRGDVLTIVKLCNVHGVFGRPAYFREFWYNDENLTSTLEEIKMRDDDPSSPSLHDLVRSRGKEQEKLLACMDYFKFARVERRLDSGSQTASCNLHLCEIMMRGFCRRWALDAFVQLTRYRLPILCCDTIVERLMNQDLCNIFLAATQVV
uniref:Ankyrin n=1 Tax=Trichogramma kaykai TaxID=54128 RepID=A0ABD2XCB0_9HYME